MSTGLLIDTHYVIWIRIAPNRMSDAERAAIEAATDCYVSAVSLLELAILVNLGRVPNDPGLFEFQEMFQLLPVVAHHCREMVRLPRRHRDPFDRMIVAQAKAENMELITRDRRVAAYREDGANILAFG